MLARTVAVLILVGGGCAMEAPPDIANDVALAPTASLPASANQIALCAADAVSAAVPGGRGGSIDPTEVVDHLAPPRFAAQLLAHLTTADAADACAVRGTWTAVAGPPQVMAIVDIEDARRADDGGERIRLGIERLSVYGLRPLIAAEDGCRLLGPLRIAAGSCVPSDLDLFDLRLWLSRPQPGAPWTIACGSYTARGQLSVAHDCARCADNGVCDALGAWEAQGVLSYSPPYLLALLRALEGALNEPLP